MREALRKSDRTVAAIPPAVAAINNIFGQLVAGRFTADVFAPDAVKPE